jgi:hypothetical protein
VPYQGATRGEDQGIVPRTKPILTYLYINQLQQLDRTLVFRSGAILLFYLYIITVFGK